MNDFFLARSWLFYERVIDHLHQTCMLSNESSNQMLYTGIEIMQSEHQIVHYAPEQLCQDDRAIEENSGWSITMGI